VNRNIYAIVPVKSFTQAKSRMSASLSPRQRRQLSRAMLFDVLTALASAQGLNGVLIVSGESSCLAMAQDFGFQFLPDQKNTGPTGAVRAAARHLRQVSCTGILALMADIPLITSRDIEQLLNSHTHAGAVTLTPARDLLGTNAVFCSPPGLIPLTFNGQGFTSHLQMARDAGAKTTVLRQPGVALDLDRPTDIAVFMERPSATRTRAFLQSIYRGAEVFSDPAIQRTG
jgi:2-phospho-L-lactate guanylyltransferase